MADEFNKNIIKIGETLNRIELSIRPFIIKFQTIISSIPPGFLENIANIGLEISKLPERQQKAWRSAAVAGWYMNGQTGLSAIRYAESDASKLDAFMSEHLIEDWDLIVSEVYDVCPERKDIIFTACKLHKEKNYIASIPLFLSQADGLFEQEFDEFLFSKKGYFESKVKRKIENADTFLFLLLQIISQENQFRAAVKHSSDELKVLAPNRAGILHGSSKHLDYGTEINSLKAFSLLAFIALLVECCRIPLAEK